MTINKTVMLVMAKCYLILFFLAGLLAYRCWYERLCDRGFGLLYNSISHHHEFVLARWIFGFLGIGGIIFLEVFRKHLRGWVRIAYVVLIALLIAFFVVDWIVLGFGPKPYWHHP
jgi:hypothetical protein